MANVDMAYLCQVAKTIPLQSYRFQSNPLPDGERDGAIDATRKGCATLVHADIREGLGSGLASCHWEAALNAREASQRKQAGKWQDLSAPGDRQRVKGGSP